MSDDTAGELAGRAAQQGKNAGKNAGRALKAAAAPLVEEAADNIQVVEEVARHIDAKVLTMGIGGLIASAFAASGAIILIRNGLRGQVTS